MIPFSPVRIVGETNDKQGGFIWVTRRLTKRLCLGCIRAEVFATL